ncbi:response regulator [Marinagarivorans algicola]|uniref:response regulator n=1 Tax=Marinagarivorans algicola TaxID=1513270 RepID=UPI0006B50F8D|nr:response regulator [Marinagarivorans algicola]
MQPTLSQKPIESRLFTVGIIGATSNALAAFNRIFSVTHHRTRSYRAVAVPVSDEPNQSIDIYVLCVNHPDVIAQWRGHVTRKSLQQPLIRLAKANTQASPQEYIVSVPLNPSKFLKTLDDYTIKELSFFPEFEIGLDDSRVSGHTLAGIRLLKNGANKLKLNGLNKALVIDDSLPVRKQIEIEFSLLDVNADLAATAEEGIEQLKTQNYDVIFLDVVMPGMDGYTACKRIRLLPHYKNVPIVLLTSKSSSFDRLKGALAGCDTYLVKPINHNDFEDVLKQHFKPKGN